MYEEKKTSYHSVSVLGISSHDGNELLLTYCKKRDHGTIVTLLQPLSRNHKPWCIWQWINTT